MLQPNTTTTWNLIPSKAFGARDMLAALAVTACAIAVMSDAWRDIFRVGFADEECSYVLLAPIVILWLGWMRRKQAEGCRISGGWIGLSILAAGWCVYWYGYLTDPVIWRAGAILTAVGAFVSWAGWKASVKLAPAIAACVFLIPVDPNGRYHIAQPLQSATAEVTEKVCDLFGMNVDRAGNLLSINGVDVTVAEACNGMRMVLTLFMVCYIVAFTPPLKTHLRLLVLAVSPLVAIVSNVARLVPTVWMFGHTSIHAAETFHAASGWVMTVLAFLLLMGLCQLLRPAAESVADPVSVAL